MMPTAQRGHDIGTMRATIRAEARTIGVKSTLRDVHSPTREANDGDTPLTTMLAVQRRYCGFRSVGNALSRKRGKRLTAHALLLPIADPVRDGIAFVASTLGSVALVGSLERCATAGWIDRKDTRKLSHVLAGPGFLLTWPLFSGAWWAQYVAAGVPALNALRLLLVGTGKLQGSGLVSSVSRGGTKAELLRGPLIYTIVLVAVTALSWRTSLPGICVIATMCGGDGLADLVGRRLGRYTGQLPWNARKSWAGSAAMLAGGILLAFGLLSYFYAFDYIAAAPMSLMPFVALIALVCTLVESIPLEKVDDNISVPVVAAGLAQIMCCSADPYAALAMSLQVALVSKLSYVRQPPWFVAGVESRSESPK